MKNKTTTLSDIAKATGFSANTVSHALNDKPDISEKTKALIKKTAEKMGYIANSSASFLRSGKSKSIAIIVPDITNPHFSVVIKEIEGLLREKGYTAYIMNTDENPETEKQAIISAKSKNTDGIIISPTQKSYENIDFLERLEIPFVLLGRRFNGKENNYVICNDENSGYLAGKYLLEKGHKDIIFLNAPLCISSAKERLSGVKKAFEEKGNTFSNVFELAPADNYDKMQEILSAQKGYTALICFSDLFAMQAISILKEMDKKVPEDVSVIGFDDILSRFKFPLGLTSLSSKKSTMAKETVNILIDILENNNSAKVKKILETKIIERKTVQSID